MGLQIPFAPYLLVVVFSFFLHLIIFFISNYLLYSSQLFLLRRDLDQ